MDLRGEAPASPPFKKELYSMIEVRVFATLRQGREKISFLKPENIHTAADVLRLMNISPEEVAILLVNGFHSYPEYPVEDGYVISLFPPVGGG